MTDIEATLEKLPVSLIPEDYLLDPLPAHWQARFDRALTYIHNHLDQSPFPSWDKVAEASAVSAFHFHRMFSSIFQETPGQYVRRARLNLAVWLLLNKTDISVTDVAMQCGFSSSQSLAKALRRETGFSAKDIKALRDDEDYEEIKRLYKPLTPPEQPNYSLEKIMIDQLECSIERHSERSFLSESVTPPDETRVLKAYERLCTSDRAPYYIITPAKEESNPFSKQTSIVGLLFDNPSNGRGESYHVKAGNYLSCRILVNNGNFYLSAWKRLYAYMMENHLEPDPEGYTVECIHNPDWSTSSEQAMDMTISLKILDTP